MVKPLNVGKNKRIGAKAQDAEIKLDLARIDALKVMPLLGRLFNSVIGIFLADGIFSSRLRFDETLLGDSD